MKEDIYTIEDIYNFPEGERAELIDGQIYYMAPPSRKHQKISGEIFASVSEYIRSNKGKCEIYAAPFAVFWMKNQIPTLNHFSAMKMNGSH